MKLFTIRTKGYESGSLYAESSDDALRSFMLINGIRRLPYAFVTREDENFRHNYRYDSLVFLTGNNQFIGVYLYSTDNLRVERAHKAYACGVSVACLYKKYFSTGDAWNNALDYCSLIEDSFLRRQFRSGVATFFAEWDYTLDDSF